MKPGVQRATVRAASINLLDKGALAVWGGGLSVCWAGEAARRCVCYAASAASCLVPACSLPMIVANVSTVDRISNPSSLQLAPAPSPR